jgi:hypothetical protein
LLGCLSARCHGWAKAVLRTTRRRLEVLPKSGAICWSNWFHWRGSSATGCSPLCPSPAAALYRPFNGHLRGRAYAAVERMSRADDFVLSVRQRRANYRSNCPDHGFVGRLVCASCNTHEGHGLASANCPGAIAHLMRCPDGDAARTIELRHQRAIVQDQFRSAHHAKRSFEPSLEALTLQGGVPRWDGSKPEKQRRDGQPAAYVVVLPR